MTKLRLRIPYFRVWYNFVYACILLFLFGLLVVTPFDHIYQTTRHGKFGNVFVVAGTYLVTALIALFIYFSRLYTNRTVLAAIPRSYLPIEKNELSKKVWRMVVKERQRSALIAWDSRPRDIAAELAQAHGLLHVGDAGTAVGSGAKLHKNASMASNLDATTIIPIDPASPPWGDIHHPGWSSPSTPDIPSLHFGTVIGELPHLLEAKAVSLAPEDPSFSFLAGSHAAGIHPPQDPEIVALLQRRPNMGMREYFGYLHALGMVDEADLHEEAEQDFLTRYEHARYSVEALTELEFRSLMTKFSGLLSRIIPLDWSNLRPRVLPSSQRGEASIPRTPRSNRASLSSILRPSDARADVESLSSTGSIVHHDAGDVSWDAG